MNAAQYLPQAILAAYEAGLAIKEVYDTDFSVEYKEDQSPLTVADRHAHEAIKARLGSDFPLLSEEGKQIPYEERRQWTTFWLVDPLDGTKEFIKKNGEFTVNIALINDGTPIMGVVFVPVTGKMYWGLEGQGSFATSANDWDGQNAEAIISEALALGTQALPVEYTIVASRSHLSQETEVFIEQKRTAHGSVALTNYGSSIKLCMVAERKAHVYPRLAPTMEWDTAAAHAVAKYAGCKVYNYETGEELRYNKENLLNPWFVVEATGEG